jgi:tetratricopeptide (TPR) repeat protein
MEILKSAVNVILTEKANINDYGYLTIELFRGFDIGIAQRSRSFSRGLPPGQWLSLLNGESIDWATIDLFGNSMTFGTASAPDSDSAKAQYYHLLGRQNIAMKEYQAAIEYYTKAIELEPNKAESWAGRGDCKYFTQDFTGAVSDYTEAIRINPYDPELYKSRGYAKYNLNDFDGADLDYKMADDLAK